MVRSRPRGRSSNGSASSWPCSSAPSDLTPSGLAPRTSRVEPAYPHDHRRYRPPAPERRPPAAARRCRAGRLPQGGRGGGGQAGSLKAAGVAEVVETHELDALEQDAFYRELDRRGIEVVEEPKE